MEQPQVIPAPNLKITDTTVRLGCTVRLLASGVQGTATYAARELSGNVRYGVQPKSADGATLPDTIEADYHFLEFVDDGISDRVTAPKGDPFPLGALVQHKFSDVSGTVIKQYAHMTGCWSYDIGTARTSLLAGGSSLGVKHVEHQHIELVEAPPKSKASTKPKAVDTKTPEYSAGNGGPACKGIRL